MEADYQHATLDAAVDDALFSAMMNRRHIMPGRVASFDKDAQTIIAEPMVSGEREDGTPFHLPPVADVPILQLGGGEFVITFNPKKGDPCLLLVADRCIDNWYETGEKMAPADFRQHDLSDCLAIVGFRPKLAAIKNLQAGVAIRKVDGSYYIHIADNGDITMKSPKVTLDTPTIDAAKAEATFKEAIIGGIKFTPHKHGGVESGGSKTNGPE